MGAKCECEPSASSSWLESVASVARGNLHWLSITARMPRPCGWWLARLTVRHVPTGLRFAGGCGVVDG